jgi:hypothetical protein
MEVREIVWEGVDWIHLAHDSDQWRDLVNTLKKPSGSIKTGNFFII